MGNNQPSQPNQEQMWNQENSLDELQRRNRYKCGENFVTQKDLVEKYRWDIYQEVYPPLQPNKEIEKNEDGNIQEDKNDVDNFPNETISETKMDNNEEKKENGDDNKEKEKDLLKGENDKEKEEKKEEFSTKKQKLTPQEKKLEIIKEELLKLDLKTKYEVDEELNKKVVLYRGDICSLEIDAIVNAAKTSLMGGGGIDGAIHSAAGENLKKECSLLDGTPTGTAKITRGYNLPCKYVVHAVGPVGENSDKLKGAYSSSLEFIPKNNLKSIALCGISTGIYGYPLVNASIVAVQTVREWLTENRNTDCVIIFCTFLPEELFVYETLLRKYFPK